MRVEFTSTEERPYRALCTDCGISRTSNPEQCGKACQFIQPNYAELEQKTHGRSRDDRGDELFFGVSRTMFRASLKKPKQGAQWTGITSTIAETLLRTQAVDAVITVAPDPADRWKPLPVLVTEPEELGDCKGMRIGYAPTLALLETAKQKGFRKLAVVGIPCQIYPLRALEEQLGFERIYVIGTPCSDNTETSHFHHFLSLLDDAPETISYLEFRADYQVELRFDDGHMRTIPFLMLPLSNLPSDFFPLTCRTCVDYTNALADIVVGYMAGEGEQWIIVRNEVGEEMLEMISSQLNTQPPGSKGNRASAVKGFQKNTERAGAGLPLRKMPDFIRPLVAWLMPKTGPRGLEFARARVEMKAIETIVHLKREMPGKIKNMVPQHVWKVASRYGYYPDDSNSE